MRPLEILKTWSPAELIVAFGEYMNQDAEEQYKMWESHNTNKNSTPPKPKRVIIPFLTFDEAGTVYE